MKKVFLLIIFFSFANCLLAQNIYTQKLSDIVSINFPGKPSYVDTLHQLVFNYTRDSAVYTVIVSDISSDFKVKPGKLDIAYDGVIDGILKVTKDTLLYKKKIKIDSLEGLQAEFISSGNPGMQDKRFMRLLLVNDKIYNYSFWVSSSLAAKTYAVREAFFNSFTIIANKRDLRQYTTISDYQTGHRIGQIIAYYVIRAVIIIGIVALIIHFIVKRRRG